MEYWVLSRETLGHIEAVGGVIAMLGTLLVLVNGTGMMRSIKPSWNAWLNVVPFLIFLPWSLTDKGRDRHYVFFLIGLALAFFGWKAIFFADEYGKLQEERFWSQVERAGENLGA